MVENTPNHGLNKYSEGEKNWTHSSDMQTIEERLVIRDVKANIQNYTPHPTATFIATDSGAVYDGDGSSWTTANRRFNAIATTSIKTTQVDVADGSITDPSGKSIDGEIAEISQVGGVAYAQREPDGLIHGWNMGGTHAQHEDPNDYADDATAIQSVVDTLESNQDSSELGMVYIPHTDLNGRELDIGSTVSLSSVVPSFYGSLGRNGPYINVSINDGGPAFEVGNMNLAGICIDGANADGDGNDCEFIRFSDTSAPVYNGGNLVAFGGAAPANSKGAIVINNRSWNGVIREVNFSGFPRSGKKTMDGMVAIGADNDTGDSDDVGEWSITGISSYSDPDNPIDAVVSDNGINWRNVRIVDNRMEGAGGKGMIHFSSGYPLIMGNQMARTENTADRIHATGFAAWIGPNVHSSYAGGNGVYVRCQGVVNNSVRYSGVGGYAIDANFNPGGSNHLQVPNPDAIAGGNSVNYQSGASNVHVVQMSSPQ